MMVTGLSGEELLGRISDAVIVSVSPTSNNDQRKQAFVFLEDFKRVATVPQKIAIADLFMRNERYLWDSSVAHYVLQVMEDIVKTSWPTLPAEHKAALKSFATGVTLAVGKLDVAEGAARVLVEIVKREPPKDWPQIMRDLDALSQKGTMELHIVSIILLRLTEDTLLFKEGQNATQRERLKVFQSSLSELVVPFLIRAMAVCTRPDLLSAGKNFIQICSVIAEAATVKHLWEQNGKLMDVILLQMMEWEQLRGDIAEFLCNILERKHSKVDGSNLVAQFFGKPAYFQVFIRQSQLPLTYTPEAYKVFKRYCEVFVGLSYQLSLLEVMPPWIRSANDPSAESLLQVFLRSLYDMLNHQSPVVSSIAVCGWSNIYGPKWAAELPEIKAYVLPLLTSCLRCLLLHELDNSNQFLEMDFMHQKVDFMEFLNSHRARIFDLIRRMKKHYPAEVLDYGLSSLRTLITGSESKFGPWSALLYLLNSCLPPLKSGVDNFTPELRSSVIRAFRPQAFAMLDSLMNFEGMNPTKLDSGILSVRLSCISKLAQTFIPHVEVNDEAAGPGRPMMIRVYSFVLQLMKNTVGRGDEATEELHTHTKNLITSLCRNMAGELVESYDEIIRTTIEFLTAGANIFTVTDRCALLESMIILTKSVVDDAKKASLVSEILAAASPFWQSPEFSAALKTQRDFLSFFGFTQPIAGSFENNVLGERRQQLFFCVSTLASTIMYIKLGDGNLLGLLENAFGMVSCILGLYDRDSVSAIPKTNAAVFELPESERRNILRPLFGGQPPETGKVLPEEVSRFQNWLQANFECACRMIGFAGRSWGNTFYTAPNLTAIINLSISNKLKACDIPVFRVRAIMKELLTHFIRHCPEECYESTVIPVLVEVCPVITRVLLNLWHSPPQDVSEQEEILLETMRQAFTKDYGNLILQRVFCDPLKPGMESGDDDVEMMEEEAPKPPSKPGENMEEVSKLGLLCLQTPRLSEALLLTIFNALSWADSQLSLRYTQLAQLIMTPLMQLEKNPLNAEGALYLMQSIINGLKVHGQFESNQTPLLNLGLTAYMNLKPRYPEAVLRAFNLPLTPVQSMENSPGKPTPVDHLDNMVFPKPGAKPVNDRVKREAFKRVFESAVQPLGESVRNQLNIAQPSTRRDRDKGTLSGSSYVFDDNINLPLFFGAS